jgi:ABC-type lipoprotein export system ATPase subunit
MDEPTGHQDDDNVERVRRALDLARSRGAAVLVATHDERIVRSADRVVRLESGRVVA